jgi:hypothetical protein
MDISTVLECQVDLMYEFKFTPGKRLFYKTNWQCHSMTNWEKCTRLWPKSVSLLKAEKAGAGLWG